MTESEAKTKWCPFVRYEQNDGPALNSYAANRPFKPFRDIDKQNMRCIASDCMAWRILPLSSEDKAVLDIEYQRTGRRLDIERKGYCGLAGRPE